MEDRMDSSQVDKIEELIRGEKETAERNFENTRFNARLFGRIQSTAETRPTVWQVLSRKPGPVMASAALVLAIAGLFLFRKLSPSPFQQTVRTIGAVLEDAGDGRRMTGQDSTAQRIATAEYTDFGWALKEVLYACERPALRHVSLTDALSHVLFEETLRAAPRGAGERVPIRKAPSPKLRTGEDFQLFFTGFLKRFEEV